MNNRVSLKMIVALAWPTILEEALRTGLQYVDSAMVGRIGAHASAAVGLTMSAGWVLNGTFAALGAGVLSCIAQAAGRGDEEWMRRACGQAVLLSLISGGLLGLIAVGVSPFLPGWLGGAEEIRRDAAAYFFITGLPMVFRAASSILGSALRAMGNTRTPMQVSALAIGVNIALNYILINPVHTLSAGDVSFTVWGAGLGVSGAAAASAVSFCINGSLVAAALWKSPVFRKAKLDPGFCPPVMRECLRVGAPVTVQRLAIHIGHVVFTALVADLGTVALATHSIALIAEQAFYIPGYGMQAAAGTLAGNAAGRRDSRELRSTVKLIVLLAVALMTALSLLLFLFPGQIMSIFTKDPGVISGGAGLLRIVAMSEPLFAVAVIMEGVFNGIGEVKAPFVIDVCSMWLVRILCAYLCVSQLGLGLNSVWICMVSDNVLRCVLITLRFFSRDWNGFLCPLREGKANV